jgi:hypothetical protein
MQVDVLTRTRTLLALTLILIISVTTVIILRTVDGPVQSLWRGHYTLLISDAVEPAEVLQSLRAAEIGPVLSSVSATVEIQAYDGMTQVPVAEVDERLDPLDPRYDPYLRKLGGLFHTGRGGNGYDIYFVPAQRGIFAMHTALMRALDELSGHWFMVEWQRGAGLLLLIPFFAAVGYLLRAMRRLAAPILLTTPVWAMVTLNGGAVGLLIATGTIFAFAVLLSLLLDRRRYERFYHMNGDGASLVHGAGVFFAAWVVFGGLLFVTQRPEQVVVFAGAVVVTVMVAAAALVHLHLRVRQVDHRLFMPVSLRPRRPGIDEERVARISLVFTGIAVAATLVGALGGVRGMPPVPQPTAAAGPAATFEDLGDLASREYSLPTLADYLAHRAFHEGMMYGRGYGFPGKGETVTLSDYSRDGDTLRRSEEVVLRYDEDWLERTLRRTEPSNAAALFVTHGAPVGVEMQRTPGLYSSLSHLIQNSALILLVLLPFLVARGYLRPRVRQGVSYVALRAQRQGA